MFGSMQSSADKPAVVVRLGHMGDVALTTGVLARRHERSGERFIVLTRSANAPLLAHHPAVADVVEPDDDELTAGSWFAFCRSLAREYAGHALIDLHGVLRSRILSLVWKGPVRRYQKLGLSRRIFSRTGSEKHRRILEATTVPQRYALAWEDEPPPTADVVPRLFLDDAEREAARQTLRPVTGGRPLVAVHPYATHVNKQWPREHWLGLTGLLAGAGFDWFVLGRAPAPLMPDHKRDFTNRTDLRETCGLLQHADLLITGDSGPMHLACGVGTPVTALFGPTVKAWGFHPAGPEDRVLDMELECRPCSLHGGSACAKGHVCLTQLEPERVMADVRRRFPD